tara:strand:+ start:582 stop:842 length:261 start_codon:yes stop_codon:yes gene_type:complete
MIYKKIILDILKMDDNYKGGMFSQHIKDKWMKHPEYIILPTREIHTNDKDWAVYDEWYKRINRADMVKNARLKKRVWVESQKEQTH